MRRNLVLTTEAARHPMRASLPPQSLVVEALPPPNRWGISSADVRDFLLAYCACFLAVSAFLL